MELVKSNWESGDLVFRRRDTLAGICTLGSERFRRFMSVTALVDDDTITAAAIAGGIITYADAACGGTLTFTTAALIKAAFPSLQVGEVIKFYIFNTGATTGTLANDDPCTPTVTLFNAAQTIAANEAALILLRYSAAGAFDAYVIGA